MRRGAGRRGQGRDVGLGPGTDASTLCCPARGAELRSCRGVGPGGSSASGRPRVCLGPGLLDSEGRCLKPVTPPAPPGGGHSHHLPSTCCVLGCAGCLRCGRSCQWPSRGVGISPTLQAEKRAWATLPSHPTKTPSRAHLTASPPGSLAGDPSFQGTRCPAWSGRPALWPSADGGRSGGEAAHGQPDRKA